jgi:hypothetical protein
MPRLNSTNFLESNIVPLLEETLVQKFTYLSSQEQFSFVHSIQKPQHLLQVMNFPLKVVLFQTPIQRIFSMYTEIMGFNYDQGIPESFLGFLSALSKYTLFNYPKFIVDSMHEQIHYFSSYRAFCYQSYVIYLILNKFFVYFEILLDP